MIYETKEWNEIEIKENFNYWVSKAEKAALLDWVDLTKLEWDDLSNMNIPSSNILKAQDVVIMKMTWLKEDELDELQEEDVNEIVKIITDIRLNSKKK